MASETGTLREGNWWKLTAVHENDGQYAWPLGENSVLQEHSAELNFFFNLGLSKYIQNRILSSTRKRPNYSCWFSLWIEKLLPLGNYNHGLLTNEFGVCIYTLCTVRRVLTWKINISYWEPRGHWNSGVIWKTKVQVTLTELSQIHKHMRTYVHWTAVSWANSRLNSHSPLKSVINLLDTHYEANIFNMTNDTKQM